MAAAVELFYLHGVQGIGIDAVAERAGVAKVTLYRHFATKAALVAAALEAADAAYIARYREGMEAAGPDPAARIAALFEGLDALARDPVFRGCIFINTGLALSDPEHPAQPIVRRHKDALRELLAAELRRAAHPDPDEAAEALLVLVDGALVAGALRPERRPARAAGALARKLFE